MLPALCPARAASKGAALRAPEGWQPLFLVEQSTPLHAVSKNQRNSREDNRAGKAKEET